MSDREDDKLNLSRQKKKILLLCENNSARSQMAEGLLKPLVDNVYDAYSVGISPSKVNPYAIIALKSILIKIKSSNQ